MSQYSVVGGIPSRKKTEKMEEDRSREVLPRSAKVATSYKPTIAKKQIKSKTVSETLTSELKDIVEMREARKPVSFAPPLINIVPNPQYIEVPQVYRGRMDEPLFDKPKEVYETPRFMIERKSSSEYTKLKAAVMKDLDKISLQLKNTTIENTLLKLKRGSIVSHLEIIESKIKDDILVPIKLLLPHISTIGNVIDLIGEHDDVSFVNKTNYNNIKSIFSGVKTKLSVFVESISMLNEAIVNYDMNLVGLYENYKEKMRKVYESDRKVIRDLMNSQTLKRLESHEKMNIEEDRYKQQSLKTPPTYKQKQSYVYIMNQYAASIRAYESYEFQLSELEDKLDMEYRDFITKHLVNQYEANKAPYNIYIAQDFMPKISFIYDVLKEVLTIDHEVKSSQKTKRKETLQTADALADEFDNLFKNFFTSSGGKRKNLKQRKQKNKKSDVI